MTYGSQDVGRTGGRPSNSASRRGIAGMTASDSDCGADPFANLLERHTVVVEPH